MIHVNDYGTVFSMPIVDRLGVAVDVSTSTTLAMRFVRPDGTILNVTPVYAVDGHNGIIQYTTLLGDLNQTGRWRVQGRVVLAAGDDFHTGVSLFDVAANI